ncbi:DUF4258 domain-containing protein [Candidatus Berkelbacteria bacterium]|nr:DUF4258 domain-containing protein [Candidatus Berkelbacteria bacterium]MBI2588477.1 DUF4258 domain-containing protein [Candidatus Berkelbacteria bacterium]
MRYILSTHARARLLEREISEEIVRRVLQNPTEISYDNKGRLLIKGLYQGENKPRLLLLAAELKEDHLKIITIIDTSKIKKYLGQRK